VRTVVHKSHDPCFHKNHSIWKQGSWLLWPTVLPKHQPKKCSTKKTKQKKNSPYDHCLTSFNVAEHTLILPHLNLNTLNPAKDYKPGSPGFTSPIVTEYIKLAWSCFTKRLRYLSEKLRKQLSLFSAPVNARAQFWNNYLFEDSHSKLVASSEPLVQEIYCLFFL